MYVDVIETPVGMIEITASDVGVTQVIFEGDTRGFCCRSLDDGESAHEPYQQNAITHKCKQQLAEYFLGKRKEFDLPLDPQGTVFQQSVWDALLTISYGQVASYLDIGNKVNNPKAVRAVGAANGRNPISIIVPCHRIIGSNGTLTGYAGGLERKSWLLKHEGVEGLRL